MGMHAQPRTAPDNGCPKEGETGAVAQVTVSSRRLDIFKRAYVRRAGKAGYVWVRMCLCICVSVYLQTTSVPGFLRTSLRTFWS